MEMSPIADVQTLYREVGEIAAWLRLHSHQDLATALDNSLLEGATGLEITGAIRTVLRDILGDPRFQDSEVTERMRRCVRYIDYLWGDPVRDDNPYAQHKQ